jgi:hypothetical protein
MYILMSHDLYPSPQLPPESEQPVMDILIDLTNKRPDELTILDFQFFTGMSMMHEPCSPEARQYLIDKGREELSECVEALDDNDSHHAIEEFGDYSWVIHSMAANIAPFGTESDRRPQLAAYTREALRVNNIVKVEHVLFDGGMRLPTIAGISHADLSTYQPVFFGPMRHQPYKQPDRVDFIDDTAKVASLCQEELTNIEKLLPYLPRTTQTGEMDDSLAYNTMGFSLANAWLLMAARIQKLYGPEAIQEAMFGNFKKIAQRVATNGIIKAQRQQSS